MQRGALSWRGGSPTSLKGRKGPKASPIIQSTLALPLTAVLSLSGCLCLSLMSTFICVLLRRQKNLGRVGPRLVSVE